MLLLLALGEFTARIAWHFQRTGVSYSRPSEWKGLRVFDDQWELMVPHHRGLYRGALFETNAAGFVGPDRATDKPPGVFRAMVIGDSVAMGAGVVNDENYASLLQRSFDTRSALPEREFQVLNIGVAGLNTGAILSRLKGLGLAYDPDLIVYGYTLNDIESESYRRSAEPRYTNPLFFNQSKSYLVRWLVPLWYSVRESLGSPEGSYRYELDDNYFHNPEAWDRVAQGLDDLASIADERDLCVVLLIHPRLVSLRTFHPFERHYAAVAEAGRERGFYVAEAFSYFEGIPGDELWILPWDQHPNARGHRLFYKALSDRLHQLPPSCWGEGSSGDHPLSTAGRDINWVSNQLEHRDPSVTLRTYAHVLPDVEVDLAFSDFSPGGTKRPEHLPE